MFSITLPKNLFVVRNSVWGPLKFCFEMQTLFNGLHFLFLVIYLKHFPTIKKGCLLNWLGNFRWKILPLGQYKEDQTEVFSNSSSLVWYSYKTIWHLTFVNSWNTFCQVGNLKLKWSSAQPYYWTKKPLTAWVTYLKCKRSIVKERCSLTGGGEGAFLKSLCWVFTINRRTWSLAIVWYNFIGEQFLKSLVMRGNIFER